VHNHHNLSMTSETETSSEPRETPRLPWHAEVGQLLTRAAQLCVQQGLDLDSFMKGAWSAYVETRPGMRDYLEEIQLRDQLEEIRKLGRMGEA